MIIQLSSYQNNKLYVSLLSTQMGEESIIETRVLAIQIFL